MESRASFSGRMNHDAAQSRDSSSSSSSNSNNNNNSSSLLRTSSLSFEHNLSSILNNPHSSRSTDASWLGWWSSSTSLVLPEFAPINTSRPDLDTSRSDFQTYLSSISEQYSRFEDIRNHSSKETETETENSQGGGGGQGEALVACLRQVPALYFKEDFQLEDGATFLAACPFTTLADNLLLQERLSHYLDVVEMHLVKEISMRSNSFFEAQQHLGDLSLKIVQGCQGIRVLKDTVRLLDVDVVATAKDIHDFSSMRTNLLALQHKLRLILYVNQALTALKLLVTSADCAGALDVADDLQHLLNGDDLTGLHCFRHLRDHVAASMESINSILSAEFMRSSLHDAGNLDALIVSRAKERASTSSNGRLDDVHLDEEETSCIRDRLLPIIIGLLRTAKLPSVLRMYRDTLTADMKTAIKTSVAELLPILVARLPESDLSAGERTGDADGGGSSLASRLRSLSTESFIQLLSAVYKIVLAHLIRAAEVKKSIEWIMSNLDGHYAAESVAAAIAHGAAATESAQDGDSSEYSLVTYSSQRSATKVPTLQGKANDVTSQSSMSKIFRADVLRENAEGVFAACDAAHGRWAKLLGVRAILHPKIRLQEFLSIYSITQEFINATEKIGGRLGYSIRGTLQSQAKAFVDFQHESRAAKIKAVLDQETWSEVDVPDEFQAIVASMLSSDLLVTGNDVGDQGGDVALSNGETTMSGSNSESVAKHPLDQIQPNNVYNGTTNVEISQRSSEGYDTNRTDAATTAARSRNSTTKTLTYRGVEYHMVNCGLILLKMLSEYIDMNDSLPTLSAEIVHRVVEVLKFFNTRSCQLVLGAHAMQVSGLKSITSKHLALASQVVSFVYAIIPDDGFMNFNVVWELLMHDYKHHQDEIHNKLVQIMSERLLHHLRGLPQIVETWNKPDDGDTQPSQFAKSLTKEVNYLQRILFRMLHEVDLNRIFGQVVQTFHARISEAYSSLEINTPQAKTRLHRDIQQILGCIRSLPTGISSNSGVANWGLLDEFLAQRFGGEPAPSM
ncbi:hypothetical protein KSS87_023678 [Heliosperma pusillum]|nr:hypothetical protein KSS87_023678 [Heliosperma pusillum]